MSTISGFNALMAQNANGPQIQLENQLRRQQINAMQAQQMEAQARIPQIQAATQGAQLANQQAQLNLTSQQAISRAWRDIDPKDDPATQENTLVSGAIKYGAMPNDVIGLRNHMVEQRKNMALADETTLKNQQSRDDDYAGKVQAILDASEGQKQGLWTQYMDNLQRDAPGEPMFAQYPGDDWAKSHIAVHMYKSKQIDEALKSQQRMTSATEQQLKAAQIPGEHAESTKKQLAADAMQAALKDPQSGGSLIHQAMQGQDPIAEQAFMAGYQAMLRAGDIEGAARMVGEVARHASGISAIAAKAPAEAAAKVAEQAALRPGEVQKALDIESATNPLKLQQARASALATSGVREALTVDQQYAKEASATEAVGKLLDAADSGNKAAGSALPVINAEAMNAINGIKRINRFDIEQAGGGTAGNMYDRVVGFFDKATVGQPIPENIRNDIRDLQQTLGENSYNRYTTTLKALSQRTGTEYKPTIQAPNIRKGANAKPIPDAVKGVLSKANPGIHTLSDGTKWMKAADGTITPQ